MGNRSCESGRDPRQLALFESSSDFGECKPNAGSEDETKEAEHQMIENAIAIVIAGIIALIVLLLGELSGYFMTAPWSVMAGGVA